MTARLALALVTTTLLLATALPVSARCMVFGGRYTRIGSGDVSASAPAIVLGVTPDYHSRDGEPVPRRLRLGRHALTVETLAPGLVVARSAAAVRAGTHTLTGLASPISVTIAATSSSSALAAPDVVSIALGAREHLANVEAELRTPPPSGAVAVVVALEGTPIGWDVIDAGASTIVEVAHQNLCGVFIPDGYRLPSAGEVVTIAWVDAAGRLSPPSSPITVRGSSR